MRLSIFLKSGLGLVYTTILIAVVYFGAVWLTQFLIKLTWIGAIVFWLVGIPIAIGLFQLLGSLAAIPSVYLMKGSKWLSWILLLPAIYFLFCFGRFLWILASNIGGALCWLVLITWFCETAWLFIIYALTAIGSAYDDPSENS